MCKTIVLMDQYKFIGIVSYKPLAKFIHILDEIEGTLDKYKNKDNRNRWT